MDTREQKYIKDTPVIFLPFPGNQYYKHYGKEGKILFQERTGNRWYINLDEKTLLKKGTPMQIEVNIKVLGEETEFKVK
jgi:hypothetical protein